MAELLLELLSEEIPARMQARAAEDLKRLVTGKLEEGRLDFGSAEAFATPRRLTLVVDGLPTQQPDLSEERKGPRVGAPEQALQGFMKANALSSIDQAEVREVKGARFYFAVRQVAGRPSVEVLPAAIAGALTAFPWPKSMRWAGDKFRWVRPLHAVLALFDGAPLDFADQAGSFTSMVALGQTETRGHRFLAPDPIAVSNYADYRKKLKQAKVILDPAEREAIIRREAGKLTKKAGLTVKEDPALFGEVAGLVEWPVVLMGRIDEAFMDLPPEVLTTAMRSHQKYFATEDAEGRFADRFLLVANMATRDKGKTIVTGNERVLRARLADARFFWDEDRKKPLAGRVLDLKDIVFHARLGTLDDKVDRLQALAAMLAKYIPGADPDRVRSAARLCKADLTTGMVGEFPELQGIMGRYYARHDGESEAVAEAIAEHYAPQGPSDRCPSAPVSVAVALADKLDTLVNFFAIDEKPTGSKDPFALRRAALGVIRLIVENGIRLPMRTVFTEAPRAAAAKGEVARDMIDFFADRLKVALRDQGVRHDLISAVFALGGEDDIVRVLARVAALESFLGTDDGANLLVAYRRAANIVRIEEKNDKTTYNGGADSAALKQEEERVLFDSLGRAATAAEAALSDEDFTGAMSSLAGLRRPVDKFFDEVTVNADDPALRANRLRLLSQLGSTLGQVADFSKIEG